MQHDAAANCAHTPTSKNVSKCVKTFWYMALATTVHMCARAPAYGTQIE